MSKGIFQNKYVCGCLVVIITLLITISYMHLWGTDIHVPLTGYRSDSIGVLLEANNYVRGGDVHTNVCYGAPNLNRYTYAIGDSSVPMPLIKLLTGILGSVEAAVNVHAILNGILLALGMYWVCCRLRINIAISMIVGISYSCLSYFVLYCNTLLLIYAFCFYIPLFCYIIIELMSHSCDKRHEHKTKISDIIFLIAVMLLVGLNSAYYAFLAMLVLAFVGLYVLISLKSVDKVLLIILSYISIGIGIAIYTMPNILYGMNRQVYELIWNSGSYYFIWGFVIAFLIGLGILFYKKIYPHITMKTIWTLIGCVFILGGVVFVVLKKYTNFLGVYDGRTLYSVELGALNIVNIVLPAINNLFESVNEELPLLIDMENQDVIALGILTGIGFCYSVMNVFRFEETQNKKDEIIRVCGLCNCFMVCLAVKGGLASLIATYVTTGIRNYNRICIFIAVFSLISFGLLIDKILVKIKSVQNSKLKGILYVCTWSIVILGFAMSCPTDFIMGESFGLVAYEQRKKEYDDWKNLMDDIETVMPKNSMIYELPVSIDGNYFGELMDAGRAYELSVPAVLSKTTSWSYLGGWRTDISIEEETELFIHAVYDAGFRGIYIDTLLYSDDSYIQQIEALKKYLGEPIVCNENRRFFFELFEYMQKEEEARIW